MNDIDRQLLAALSAGRGMLRKMPHWGTRLVAEPAACTGAVLDYAAVTEGPVAASNASEIVYVERSLLPLNSPEFAWPSAARWSALKRVDRALLVTEATPVEVTVDGVTTPARAWLVGAFRLVVAVAGDLRIETWAPSDLDVAVIPLAPGDRVDLSWRTHP